MIVAAAALAGPAKALDATLDGVAGASGPITLSFPEPPEGDTLARLAIELDGVDVTALLAVDGNRISITPISPLAPGEHELILYLLGADTFEIAGSWSFTVEASDPDQSAAQRHRLEVDALHEAAAITGTEGDTLSAVSAGEAEARLFDERMIAGVNYLFATEEEAQATGNLFDIGSYFAEYRDDSDSVQTRLRLGQQVIDYDDILISDLNNRGAGIEVTTADGMITVAGFGANPDSNHLGLANFTGLEERDDRIFGGAVTFRPFGEGLAITASGYGGKATDFDGVTVGEGHGGALSLEAALMDGRLRLNGSGAWTRSDPDGSGGLVGAETGYAVTSLISYDVLTGVGEDGGAAPSLTLSAGYDRIEESYLSYAFLGQATGRQSFFGDAYYSNGPFSLDAHALVQTDNVESNPDFATNRLIDLSLSGFRTLFEDGDGPAWLGQSSVDASLQFQTQDQIDASAAGDPDADYTSISAGLGFTTFYDGWGWNARYGFADHNDESDFDFDERRHALTLGLTLSPLSGPASGYVLDLAGTAATVELNQGKDRLDFDIGTSLVAPLIQDKLALTSSYQVSFSTDTEGLRGGDLTADLSWQVVEGIAIAARSGLQHGDSALSGDLDYYGGLVLRIATPFSWPGDAK